MANLHSDPNALLASPQAAELWLKAAQIDDPDRGYRNLVSIAKSGITLDLLQIMLDQLEVALPQLSDADMALNNLERFFSAVRSPLSFAALCQRDETALTKLLQIFSISQFLADVIIRQPAIFESVRENQGAAISATRMRNELKAELASVADDEKAIRLLNNYKRRQMVRIAYGDVIRGQTMSVVTRQISYLADAICEAALDRARNTLKQRFGVPKRSDGTRSQLVVLALGKLGGLELNYSSDIDLIFLYDEEGHTAGDGIKQIENREFYDRLIKQFMKWLTQSTAHGTAYRVDLRLRPEGAMGPAAMNRTATLHYYDVMGRTWERQAMVKARPIAGDLVLGHEFLETLSHWVYRSYLSQTEIAGIKALKRKIERRTIQAGDDRLDVKTGHGGIRDIEFVIQFLQLLVGADAPEVRTGNTLDAIVKLSAAGVLSSQEQHLLASNYVFLRKIEHRLQMMFDRQTHRIPDRVDEQRKLALRLGYRDREDVGAAEQLMQDLAEKTALNRRVLDHLLHDAVRDDSEPSEEVDLILDPQPEDSDIRDVLGKRHGFSDPKQTYRLLMDLATERIPFLSKRRCRHFLAAIAPQLLTAVAETPDPEATLVALCRVSDSLGGKAALWELLHANQASLELYVRLCAACPYLSGILTSNPGMLDEFMDSLLLERLPTPNFLSESLAELCGKAIDIAPILMSFKHAHHLRVGARDIVGHATIRETTRALSDIAEVCLQRVVAHETIRLVQRYGQPIVADTGEPCELITLAAGKLGGREPNYHSDLDVIFVFEGDGHTSNSNGETITNQHFFAELGQRVMRAIGALGPQGRLYPIDARLRPTGKSGSLAISLAELEAYFRSGAGQLWERLALCKARTVTGSPAARASAAQALHRILTQFEWQSDHAIALRKMRLQMQETAAPMNLKRGPGGTVDIEFAVQMLQLRYGRDLPQVLVTGVWEAVEQLDETQIVTPAEAKKLTDSYTFLRSVEARLRLMNTQARHDFPTDELELKKLAFLLRQPADALEQSCRDVMRGNRALFEDVVQRLSSE